MRWALRVGELKCPTYALGAAGILSFCDGFFITALETIFRQFPRGGAAPLFRYPLALGLFKLALCCRLLLLQRIANRDGDGNWGGMLLVTGYSVTGY